jgi:hypothetical protein
VPNIENLVTEVVALKITTSLMDKGIHVAGCADQIRLLVHADDTACFAADIASLEALLYVYAEHSLFSGSRLKRKKVCHHGIVAPSEDKSNTEIDLVIPTVETENMRDLYDKNSQRLNEGELVEKNK